MRSRSLRDADRRTDPIFRHRCQRFAPFLCPPPGYPSRALKNGSISGCSITMRSSANMGSPVDRQNRACRLCPDCTVKPPMRQTQQKGRTRFPPRAQFETFARCERLLAGSRSSRVSSRTGSRGSRSSSVNRSSGSSSGVSRRSSRIGGSSFAALASRKAQSSAGNGSGENDLAHEWYSLNSEWTTRDTNHLHGEPRGKPTP